MSNDNERNEEDARDHRASEDGAPDWQNTGQPIAPTPVNEPESAFDVAGAALGALAPGEEADVYTAASVDPAVSAELAAMEAVVAELARLAPVQQMNRGRSAGIRSRLVARAAATNVGRQASPTGAAAESEHAA
ncbi:MAG TPA: hypothetical protein VLI40_14250, partial [Gemmatimonadaceae bacterium]|nr:hypothetical protein [Gemmatimonadaceae bacterium]